MREPEPMREIHEIQERLYEEEKNLSPKDRLRKIHEEAHRFLQRHKLAVKEADPKFVSQ